MGNTAAMNLQQRPSNNLPEETIEAGFQIDALNSDFDWLNF